MKIGGDVINYARKNISHWVGDSWSHYEWPIMIDSSTTSTETTNIGTQASWNSGKKLELEVRRFASGHTTKLHETVNWNGGSGSLLVQPTISITALS